MATMKAAVFDGKGGVVTREVTRPEVRGAYEVLCRLEYGATCTGTDSHILEGCFPFGNGYPAIAGHESVGRVVALGDKVRHFREGDLITRVGTPPVDGLRSTWGGYAEWGIGLDHWAMAADGRPESEWSGARWNQVVPAGVDPRAAPMFTTWRETVSFLRRMGVGSGARVLVLGSGGNGLSFARMALLLGARTVAMMGSARMETTARGLGATTYADYRVDDPASTLREYGPFDFIIDAVGKVGQLNRVLSLTAPGAKVSIYGLDDLGEVTLDPTASPSGFGYYNGGYDEAETHQLVSDWCRSGALDCRAWYDPDRPYALDDLAAVFQALKDRKAPKALLRL